MTPQAYCAALEQALQSMPPEERQEILRYYLEFLEDASESERDSLGTPEELAERILRENGIPKPAQTPPKSHRALKITLLACTFYIWLPLLLTYYVLLLVVLVCLLCIPLALLCSALICIAAGSITLFQDVPPGLLFLGSGFACLGISILLTPLLWIACRAIVKFVAFSSTKFWQFVTGQPKGAKHV